MSGNQDHFDRITRAVGEVRDWYGTTERDGDYRGRLLVAAIQANGGRRTEMVDRIVAFQAEQVGRGTVMTPKGLRQGRGVHAKRRRRESQVRVVREYVYHRVGQVASELLGRGEPIPSARRVGRILREQEFPCGETSIRTGLRAMPQIGTPVIDRNRARLPRPCRDLIEAFEAVMPRSSVSHTSLSECMRKIFVPSANPSTQRTHWRRLDAALKALEAARHIGISVRRSGSTVFVGRGRAVPENGYAWARENPPRHYDLSPGIANGREGLWSSAEGKIARALVETMHDPGDMYVGPELAELHDIVTTAAIEDTDERAHGMLASVRRQCHNAAELSRGAYDRFNALAVEREKIDQAFGLMIRAYYRQGLSGLWKAAQEWPGLKARAKDPASRRRVAMIAERFEKIECPSIAVESERFAHLLWLDTPVKYRSPAEPKVSDYMPKVPRLKPIEHFVRRAKNRARYKLLLPRPYRRPPPFQTADHVLNDSVFRRLGG